MVVVATAHISRADGKPLWPIESNAGIAPGRTFAMPGARDWCAHPFLVLQSEAIYQLTVACHGALAKAAGQAPNEPIGTRTTVDD